MNVTEAMLNRRTVHLYEAEPLPEGAIERGLEAAMMAPNHRLTYPWRFYVTGPETRREISALARRLKFPDGPTPEQEAKLQGKVDNPGALIIVSQVRCDDPNVSKEDYATASCAIHNLTLSLFAEGVYTKWSTGKIMHHPEIAKLIGLDQEQEEVVGFIWAGIAAKVPQTPPRPALGDVVTHTA